MINNNNNNNNIDNNTKSEKNEILFWKVFHNKYIRDIIINNIESNIENENEIKKFKEIKTFDWFIGKNQHELLKCKLAAGEDIEITNESLTRLFKKLIKLDGSYQISSEKEIHYINSEFREDYQIENFVKPKYYEYKKCYGLDKIKKIEFNEKDKIKSKELEISTLLHYFQLLFKYKTNEIFKKFKLFLSTFKSLKFHSTPQQQPQPQQQQPQTPATTNSNNSTSIIEYMFDQFLLNQEYQNIVHVDFLIFDDIMSLLSASILNKLLLNLKNTNRYSTIVSNSNLVVNNSIAFASRNQRYRDEMISFILNDQQLYSKDNFDNDNKNNFSNNKLFKFNQVNYKYATKLEPINFFKIKSTNIQIKLLELNYFYVPNDNYKNEKDQEIRIKNIFKYYSTTDLNIYIEYLYKYDEPIDGIDDTLVWEYSINSKSVNALKYLFKKNFNPNNINNLKDSSNQIKLILDNIKSKEFTNCNNDETFEFIKLFTNNVKDFSENSQFIKQLLKFINLVIIKSKEEYEKLLNSINFENDEEFTDSLPKKWFSNGKTFNIEKIKESKRFLIQDIETIDLIYKQFKYYSLLYENFNKEYSSYEFGFKFETIQLIEYAKLKYGSDSFFFQYGGNKNESDYEDEETSSNIKLPIPTDYFIYPFTKAINNCDIESLKKIQDILLSIDDSLTFERFQGDKSIKQYSETASEKIKEFKEIITNLSPIDNIKINFNFKIDGNEMKIKELFDYLNYSNGFKLFSPKLLSIFLNDISKLGLSKEINFTQNFENQLFETISSLLSRNINPNALKLILNNCRSSCLNPFSTRKEIKKFPIEASYDLLTDKSYYMYNRTSTSYYSYAQFSIYDQNINGNFVLCYSYESSKDIISCIELILNYLKTTTSGSTTATTTDNNNNNNNLLNNVQMIINYLFKRLIKVKSVKLEQVKQVYQFIKSSWLSITNGSLEFKFQHNLYHIFFYLSIVSAHGIINYFLQQNQNIRRFLMFGPYFYQDPNFHNENFCKSSDDDIHTRTFKNVVKNNNILSPLKPEILSYDFIFNNRLEIIANKIKTLFSK